MGMEGKNMDEREQKRSWNKKENGEWLSEEH